VKKLAVQTALLADGVGHRQNFRVGAVLLDGKRIVNAKTNTGKSHRILSAFTSFPLLHAETNCVISHGLDHCDGLDIVVARVHMDGNLSMARPCETCRQVLGLAGIKKAYYTTWTGKWECEQIN
jgi:deoxycytidylate deaminase